MSLTPKEFVEKYLDQSGVTPEFLIRHNSVVVTCDCEAPNCLGWQMQNQQWVDALKNSDRWPSKWKAFPLSEIFGN